MRPQSRDKLLSAMDELAKTAGANSVDDMVDRACVMFEKLIEFASPMRTRAQAIEVLDKLEMTPAEERLLLASIKMTPMLIRFGIKKLAKTAVNDLPAPPTGRKPALASDKSVEVIDFVAKMNRDGYELGSCLYRASQRFGIGYRSVERIWNNRAEILQNGPEPHFEDVLQMLTK